jgi:hypothetical protein
MMVEVETKPFIVELSVLSTEPRVFEFIKFALVVEAFPFTVEVSVNEFVLVEIVSEFVVEEATRLVRSVLVDMPFSVEVRLVPLVERDWVVSVVVATTPLTTLVSTLPVTLWVNEFMIFAKADCIPFTIVEKVLVVVERVLVVVAGISEARLVVDITPFTLDVMIDVEVANDKLFEPMTLLVATTPFTVVVRVLPERVVVSEFMMLVNSVETPFTIDWRVLVVVAKVFIVGSFLSSTRITSPFAFTLSTFPLAVVVAEVEAKLENLSPDALDVLAVISSLFAGVVLPIPTFWEPFIDMALLPPVLNLIELATALYIPVSVSPVNE